MKKTEEHISLAKKELNDFDKVFKALAHPTRRQILVIIRSTGSQMITGDIVKKFEDQWPTISRHLKLLQQAGLLKLKKTGREITYTIDNDRMKYVLSNWLQYF